MKPLSLIFCFFLFWGCQTEENVVLTEDPNAGFSQDSAFHYTVQRTAMHDGSEDDQFDDSPCFSVVFPFEITYAGIEFNVTSLSELTGILLTTGIDDIARALNFPITFQMSDYSLVTVNNWQQFLGLQQSCRNDLQVNEGPITCLEFSFPVTVYVYDTNTQQTSSATIGNKRQLFEFFENTASGEVLNFNYPVELVLDNGSEIEVNNRAELEAAINFCS